MSKTQKASRSYHHGDLRQVLIDQALRLIETDGLERVSVREVARAAGVSPAAPFRHFANRTALLTAIAEQAFDKFARAVDDALADAPKDKPLLQYRAIGVGFFRWAFAHPQHFDVISTRAVIDFEAPALRMRNDRLRELMSNLVRQAQEAGHARPGDPARIAVAGRALAYGVVRMYIDGQFLSWGLNAAAPFEEAVAFLDEWLDTISAPRRE